MNNEKHYNTLNNFYREKYQKKVFKVSLNAGFSCPHGACSYCSTLGSGDFAGDANLSITKQFDIVKDIISHKWPDAYYIAYFQARTNTNAPVNILKEKYEEAINCNRNIKEISIATRADAISDECLDYLESLNQKIPVQVELGLQTIKQETAKLVNLGHDLDQFTKMVLELKKRGISVVIHIINGLPYETMEDMLKTASYVANLGVDGIKIHMLHIMYQTPMGESFLVKPFPILSLEEYVSITAYQISMMPLNMIIHRVTGDAPANLLIEPKWTLKKLVVINEIDKYMRKNDLWQGQNYKKTA